MGLECYLGRFWHSSEPMFGVIMVISFINVLLAEDTAGITIQAVLLPALFCCIAWGIVDGLFFAWENHYEFDKKKNLLSKIRISEDPDKARKLIEDDLGDTIVNFMDDKDKEKIYRIIEKNASGVDLGHLKIREDIMTVLVAFSLVAGASIIVMLPFLLIPHTMTALNISIILGIVLLFFVGCWREEDKNIIKKLATGGYTSLVASIITIVTVSLGG